MALRRYFKKAQELKNLSNVSADEVASEVESVEYHEADVVKDKRFIPQVDFSDPANFARYGSASEYYEQAIKRIYSTYPYDGSLKERLDWENESSYIDLYIFDNKYPRTNGHAIFSADGWGTPAALVDGYGVPDSSDKYEYIYIKGGPNANPDGMSPYATQFTGSNYYDTSANRENNLKFDPGNSGASIEFWMKKDGFNTTNTKKEVIFDLWNNELSSSADYGRVTLELTASGLGDPAGDEGNNPIRLTIMSGAYGFANTSIASSTFTTGSVTGSGWAHYAVTMKNETKGRSIKFDGGDDAINIGSDTTWDAQIGGAGGSAKAFTLSAWVYLDPAAQSDDARIFDFSNGDRRLNYRFLNSSTGDFVFKINGATDDTVDSTNITEARWYHVVATYTGGNAGYLRIYVDGSIGGISNDVLTPTVIAGDDCFVGNDESNDYPLNGYLSDLSVWDTTLTAGQITELYNSGIPTNLLNHSAVANLLSWYPMGDINEDSLDGTNVSSFANVITDKVGKGGRRHGYASSGGMAPEQIVSYSPVNSAILTRLYVNGDLENEKLIATDITTLSGKMGAFGAPSLAHIGSLVTSTKLWNSASAAGKFSGSLDEFRYWKTQRSSKDIGKYWFTQVGGGTNSDPTPGITATNLVNTTLGVYYKFNEGITGTGSVDKTVLDYSGRVTNGSWEGYTSVSRNTDSAMVLASAATKEFKDPIIYANHSSVISLQNELEGSGSWHDTNNNASLYNAMPGWVTEEDELGSKDLKRLTQIMSSYFDSLQLQIESLNKLKDKTYPSGSDKPLTFANRLLESSGLIAPEMFLDADILEKLADRSEDRLYGKTLEDIKNTIYQNIYNNLSYIYKTKGTEKAFRNLIRCYGIDDELIKFNLYANNIEYELQNNSTSHVLGKRYVDFNTTASIGATVYQTGSCISGSTHLTGGFAFTTEASVIFPVKAKSSDKNYISTQFLTASIFGVHSSSHDSLTYGGIGEDDAVNFQVYAVRDELESPNVRFRLTSSEGARPLGLMPALTSSLYEDVYDNTNWTFAVRIKPEKYPYAGLVNDPTTGSSGFNSNANYIVEFRGINIQDGVVLNEFNATGTVAAPPAAFITGSRRLYAGAHLTNFTGALQQHSDIKVGTVRHWLNYLEDDALLAHAKDIQNFGTLQATEYAYSFLPSASIDIYSFEEIYSLDTLALNWDFNQVTSSNASGEFTVADFSSGSVTLADSRHGWIGPIINVQHPAQGTGFVANDTRAIDKEYITISKQNLPEDLKSQDMISIYGITERDLFTRNIRPTNFSYAFEKSMSQIISEQILDYFGTIRDFHNLIGEPVNRYRMNYKMMEKARQSFFERVKNPIIDFDKFYEFYKWFDSSLSIMLMQLVPASADVAENIRTMIESHALERNKYQTKFPTVEFKEALPIGPTTITTTLPFTLLDPPLLGGGSAGTPLASTSPTKRQIGTSDYRKFGGWKYGHAPIDDLEKNNHDFWKDRVKRTHTKFGGDTPHNRGRQKIFTRTRENICKEGQHYNKFKKRCLDIIPRQQAAPYRFSMRLGTVYRSYDNYHCSKRFQAIFNIVRPDGGLKPGTNLPENVALAFADDVEQLMDVADVAYPVFKQRLGFKLDAKINKPDDNDYMTANGKIFAPFSLYSSSVNTGYNSLVQEKLISGTMITNLHGDGYGIKPETPMQGPFTEGWVGGREYRHAEINRYDPLKTGDNNLDSPADRPEGFKLLLGLAVDAAAVYGTTTTGAVGIVDPQYPQPDSPAVSPPYLYDRPKGHMTRGFITKRPVNIRNILSSTGSGRLGNYMKNYQVIQTAARSINDPFWNDQSFTFGSGSAGAGLNPETLATRGRFPLTASRDDNGIRAGSWNPSGNLDYELPDRTGTNSNKTVFVNLFSAPGSYEVLSRGYRDVAHEEKSVYNALPWRNTTVTGLIGFNTLSGSEDTNNCADPGEERCKSSIFVNDHCDFRRGLKTLLTLHCGPFGSDPTYMALTAAADMPANRARLSELYAASDDSTPSFHKVNRNRRYRYEADGSSDPYAEGAPVLTGSLRDNWWVQHPIPAADRGYSWIAACLPSGSDYFTYTQLSGGFITSLPTISSSDFRSYLQSTANGFYWGAPAGYPGFSAFPTPGTPFNGMNTNVREPVSCSSNHLGFPVDAAARYYINIGNEGQLTTANAAAGTWPGGLMSRYFDRDVPGGHAPVYNGLVATFNAVMLHRNGACGHSSWKQIRTGNHPVVRQQKTINVVSDRDPAKQFIYYGADTDGPWNTTVVSLKGNTFTSYIEQAISSRHYPILFAYTDVTNQAGVVHKLSWANNLDYFSNEKRNNRLDIAKEVKLGQPYNSIINLILNNPVLNNTVIEYKERMYPPETSCYQNRIRARTNYTTGMGLQSTAISASIWNTSRSIRSASGSAGLHVINSQGHAIKNASVWPLDGNINFGSSRYPITSSAAGTNDMAGELLNDYCRFHTSSVLGGGVSTVQPAALYACRVPVGSSSADKNTTVYQGDALFEVSTQSGQEPYRTYEEYMEFLRLTGKDHSVVPEFRISSHLESMVEGHASDWLIEHDEGPTGGLFEISGAAVDESAVLKDKVCDIEDTDKFYKVYGPDFFKYFKVVDDDINEKTTADGTIIKKRLMLECSAKVKFLPYKGFYPVERTTELARIFSASYGDYMSTAATMPTAYRAIVEPLFAPGILYNSIKSSVAVGNYILNYPALDKEEAVDISTHALDSAHCVLNEGVINFGEDSILSMSSPDGRSAAAGGYGLQRIPFEALIRPENYFNTGLHGNVSGSYIMDTGIGSCSLSAAMGQDAPMQRVQWNGGGLSLYRMAIDNFLCESVNFFLKKDPITSPNGLTTILGSKTEANFGNVDEDQIYALTIKMYRTPASDGTADRSSFEYYNRDSAYGYPVALDQADSKANTGVFSASFSHVTPSHHYGEGTATIVFKAPFGGAPNMDTIKSNSSIIYSRDLESTSYSTTAPGYWFAMQLSGSLNIMDKATTDEGTRWMIQTKWEAPLLDFADVSTTAPHAGGTAGLPTSSTQAALSTQISTTGMWHQYANVPNKTSKGVFIDISTPETVTDAEGTTYRQVKSLAEIVGLDDSAGKPIRIGSVRDRLTLEEAVIVVPFTTEENQRKFFRLRQADMPRVQNILQKYILPPKFDFMLNPVDPILFYAFEFDLTLKRDDIIKLWQNVLFANDESFEQTQGDCDQGDVTDRVANLAAALPSTQICSCCIEDEDLINQIYACVDNLEWLVFKVKVRAEKDYNRYVKKGIPGASARSLASISPNVDSKYSYNWPYDYFSIAEIIKIDSAVKYLATDLTRIQQDINGINQQQQQAGPLRMMQNSINMQTATTSAACVIEGTIIHTNRGEIPVEEVAAEDKIYAYDFEKKEFNYYDILGLRNSLVKRWVKLITEDGYEVGCSETHAFYSDEHVDDRIWTADLRVGDTLYVLRDENLERGIIKTIEYVEEEARVYNFTVDKVEAYFSDGILSHNMPLMTACPDGSKVVIGTPCPPATADQAALAAKNLAAAAGAVPGKSSTISPGAAGPTGLMLHGGVGLPASSPGLMIGGAGLPTSSPGLMIGAGGSTGLMMGASGGALAASSPGGYKVGNQATAATLKMLGNGVAAASAAATAAQEALTLVS